MLAGTYFARDASYAHEYTDVRSVKNLSKDASARDAAAAAAAAVTCSQVAMMRTVNNDKELREVVSPADDDSDSKMTDTDSNDDDSDDASSSSSRQLRLMVAACVFVGHYTVGQRTYRKPPPVDPSKPFGSSFDACVNYIDDPTLFVIFDSSQCYPQHFITYCCQSQ